MEVNNSDSLATRQCNCCWHLSNKFQWREKTYIPLKHILAWISAQLWQSLHACKYLLPTTLAKLNYLKSLELHHLAQVRFYKTWCGSPLLTLVQSLWLIQIAKSDQSEENQPNDFGKKKKKEFRDSSMSLDGVELLPKASVKYLGVELDDNLEWKKHVMNLRAKCLLALRRLSRISRDLPQETRKEAVLCTCTTPCWLLLCSMGSLFKTFAN